MKLEQFRENPDGSADFNISDLTEEEVMSFVRLGIVKALEDAIEDAKKYDPNLVAEVKEPVAWVLPNGELVVRPDFGGKIYYSEQSVYNDAPPPKQKEWVGLTSDDIRQLEKENTVGGYNGDYCPTWDLIESVEAFLREKNTET